MPTRSFPQALFWICLAAVIVLALMPIRFGVVIHSSEKRHLLAFVVLAVLAMNAWPRIGLVRLWVSFAVLGAFIEFAQWATDVGRSAEWSDWLYDLAAVTIALVCGSLFRLALSRPTAE
jgi:hypothetical protein